MKTTKTFMPKALVIAAALLFAGSISACNKSEGGSSPPTTVGEGSASDGILGSIAGLFGGDSADGMAAPSDGIAVASSSGGGKAATFYKMFTSELFHMKAKTTAGGMEVLSETFVKGGMVATTTDMGGMTIRSIMRDGRVYSINDQTRTVISMAFSSSAGGSSEDALRTAGMVVTGSGTAQFNGKNLPYEEYSHESGSVKVRYFLDGNNLAGVRIITDKSTIDMIVLLMDKNVPNNVFDIPSGYQKIEM